MNKLILKAEVKVIEVVDEGDTTANEALDVCGFQVLYSQVWDNGKVKMLGVVIFFIYLFLINYKKMLVDRLFK